MLRVARIISLEMTNRDDPYHLDLVLLPLFFLRIPSRVVSQEYFIITLAKRGVREARTLDLRITLK
jgi:hypothetical protein